MATEYRNQIKGAHQATLDHRGMAVIYEVRGGKATDPITVTPGRSRKVSQDSSGVSVIAWERDWIIDSDALMIDGKRIRPKVGDRIVVQPPDAVGDEKENIYEVQRRSGEPCFQFIGPYGDVIRVHTRKVGGDV